MNACKPYTSSVEQPASVLHMPRGQSLWRKWPPWRSGSHGPQRSGGELMIDMFILEIEDLKSSSNIAIDPSGHIYM